ncbi:hypothetical protein CLHUN_02310 [Ruminiclostridium hungatei]|uniref:MFS transporter n=1 Tax=Ruminiclostridium hungatei TaxID=48256 RepID=A0A1V4SSI8_RUMHU|nr:hypothetical protein [Ruminiclostridium hungatei]OPX46415.1 hypothetical protein CLHUN_02310 [Ruminiclostridium hungatei]
MIKWLFKGIFGRIDMFALGIFILLSSHYDNPLLILLFIPWAGISSVIEKKL